MNIFGKVRQFKSRKNNSLLSLYISLFGILICILCLAGTTWSWFIAEKNIDTDTIKAADKFLSSLSVLRIEEVIGEPDENGKVKTWFEEQPVPLNGRQYGKTFYADANVLYDVNAMVDGSAEYGFLMVKTPDGDFYTTEESCSFGLLLSQSGDVYISVSWGEETGRAKNFGEGETIGYGELPVAETKTEESTETDTSEESTDTDSSTDSDSTSDTQSEETTEADTQANDQTEEITQNEDTEETDYESELNTEASDTEESQPESETSAEISEISSAEDVSETEAPSEAVSETEAPSEAVSEPSASESSEEAAEPTVSQTESTSSATDRE